MKTLSKEKSDNNNRPSNFDSNASFMIMIIFLRYAIGIFFGDTLHHEIMLD